MKILENVLETSEKNGYHETEVNANGPVVKKPAKNSNGKMSEEELKLLERDIEKVVRGKLKNNLENFMNRMKFELKLVL